MATTTCELKWLKGILSNLGIDHGKPMIIHCDSQAAMHIAKNPVFHERTKHIEVDCHFVRNEILKDNICPICLDYCSTCEYTHKSIRKTAI